MCTSTAYHPQTDGQTERYNRVIEQALRMYVQPHGRDWDKFLPMCEFAINNGFHSSIGTTPFYMNYGFHPKTPLSLTAPVASSESGPALSFLSELQTVQKSATEYIQKAQQRMRSYVNQHRKEINFHLGQLVLLKTTNLHLAGPKKFLPRYIGSFHVIKKHGPVAYRLELPSSWKIHPVFHVSLLRAYRHTPGNKLPPLPATLSDSFQVHSIVGHDYNKCGKQVFLRLRVHYKDKSIPDSMEFERDLLPDYQEMVTQYKKHHGLQLG